MAKGKGLDPIADANELAQHNINPYYWVNKVTSYTYARWMAEKKVAAIVLPLYLLFWVAILYNWSAESEAQHERLWSMLWDFSNAAALAQWVSLILFAFYTAVALIMVLQLLSAKRPVKAEPERHAGRKAKKQPKRRKDYH